MISLSLNLDVLIRLTNAALERAVPKSMQPIQFPSRRIANKDMKYLTHTPEKKQ
jgi:hypothetical protein